MVLSAADMVWGVDLTAVDCDKETVNTCWMSCASAVPGTGVEFDFDKVMRIHFVWCLSSLGHSHRQRGW